MVAGRGRNEMEGFAVGIVTIDDRPSVNSRFESFGGPIKEDYGVANFNGMIERSFLSVIPVPPLRFPDFSPKGRWRVFFLVKLIKPHAHNRFAFSWECGVPSTEVASVNNIRKFRLPYPESDMKNPTVIKGGALGLVI